LKVSIVNLAPRVNGLSLCPLIDSISPNETVNAAGLHRFHYRFSTRVGTDMRLRIGEYVVKTVMQPVETSSR